VSFIPNSGRLNVSLQNYCIVTVVRQINSPATSRGSFEDNGQTLIKGRFITDITFFSLAEAIAGIVYFFFIIVSARLLGVENFGLFQAVMGIYGILFLMGHPLKVATMHAVATSEDKRRPFVLGSFLRLALFTGGTCFLFLVVLSPYLAKILHADSIWPIIWVAFLLLVNIILTTFYGDLQGKNSYLFFSSTKVVGSLIVLVLGVTLIKMGFGASGAIAGYAGSMGLLTIYFFTRRKFFSFRKGFYSFRHDMVSLAKPLAVIGTHLFVMNFPAIVARMRLTEDMAGLFGTLFSLRNLVLPFAMAIVLPLYSRTISKQNEPRMLLKAVILIFSFGSVFIAIGLFCPQWFFKILYGLEFVTASSYMALYAFAILMHMISIVVLFHEATKETFSFGLLLIPVVMTASLTIFPHLTIWMIIVFHILSWGVYLVCLAGYRLVVAPTPFKTAPAPPGHGRDYSETPPEEGC
jgi:O-antigen/teichoic acid export membrane protein